ncbi:MAG: hypothetical protein ABH827_00730 [bacterium]
MKYKNINVNLFLFALSTLFFFGLCHGTNKNAHKNTKKILTKNKFPGNNNKKVLTLLNQTSEKIVDKKLPPSIGFFSADLKYDGKIVKFCEIGNGLYGVPLPAYTIIDGQKELLYTPYWDLFWHFLAQFNLPILYVGNKATNSATLLNKTFGGKLFTNISELETFCEQNFVPTPNFKATKITDHSAILAYAGSRCIEKIENFKKKYPNILFVNNFDALYKRQKEKIHGFFNCPELQTLRPRWKAYQALWTPTLAAQIKKELPCKLYVIKPSIGHSAVGVTLVEKEKLDDMLKVLLKNQNYKQAHKKETPMFVVEEFVTSKTIMIDKKTYDPTLRAAFAIYCDDGKIISTFFSCFWKIPPYSLSDNVPLTKKHITASMIGCSKPGDPVGPQCMGELLDIFDAILPTVYEKMLLSRR